MSRILRRPMFRGGGSVDSYGTGIAAPLVPGYRMGGNVRGGIVDLPGGYNLTANERALFNASDMAAMSNSGVTKGIDLLKRNQAITSGAVPFTSKNIPAGVIEEDKTVTTTDDGKSEEVQTSADIANDFDNLFGEKDTVETITLADGTTKQVLTESEGPSTDVLVNLPTWAGGITREEKKIIDRKNELEEIQNKLDAEDGSVRGGGDDMSKKSIEVQEPGAGSKPNLEDTEASLAIDPKDAIAQNQALFAELLGADKARGQDIGDMLLRFSGAGGNTIGEKFQNYTRAESAAGPSRSEKIKQTAAGLAINDYVAGKRSKEQIEALKTKIDYTQDKKNAALQLTVNDDLSMAKAKASKLTDKGINSDETTKALIQTKVGTGVPVFRAQIKFKDVEKKKDKLKQGYNLVDDEGTTRIVIYDGNNVNVVGTIDEFWSS